jgi:hypothetical protein
MKAIANHQWMEAKAKFALAKLYDNPKTQDITNINKGKPMSTKKHSRLTNTEIESDKRTVEKLFEKIRTAEEELLLKCTECVQAIDRSHPHEQQIMREIILAGTPRMTMRLLLLMEDVGREDKPVRALLESEDFIIYSSRY